MKSYKNYLLISLMFSNIFFCFGQSTPYESVSIYEFGEPVTNCDINMKNLLKNWVPEIVVNANEYEFLEWSFVETISDSSRYVHYRNYFSGTEPVYKFQMEKSEYSNGKTYDSLWIYPGFIHPEIQDTRGMPDIAQTILTEEVRLKAKNILFNELNIDTLNLNYYTYHKTDSIESSYPSGAFSKSVSVASHNIAYIDTLSQNYIDINVTREKNYDDLSIEERRELFLEELLLERIIMQISFNETVEIGDKVFVIKFKHYNKNEMNYKFYNNYIICNSETNKVVHDHFFLGIYLKKYE